MELTQNSCLVCGCKETTLFLNLTDNSISKETFSLHKCNACDFVFTHNPPLESECGKYYESKEYISHSDTNEGILYKLYHLVRSFMLGQKRKMIQAKTDKKTLLDVGSGTGYFLYHMAQNGYDVRGIEIDDQARMVSRQKFDLEVETPNVLLNSKNQKKADIITFWHVIEHLYTLDNYIEKSKELLTDKGWIIIAVPNRDSFDANYYGEYWAAYDVPRHLWHFTPKHMEKYLDKHGLQILDTKVLPFDPFYNSILSAKYKGSFIPMLSGGLIGVISFLKSMFVTNKASSLVYFVQSKA